ncbi:MAG: hypothetical protein V1775_08335 [Bacteroidota bacterium]
MATITIKMDKNSNAERLNFVYVDGKKIGRLSHGETQNFDVQHGNHNLEIRSGLLRIIRSRQVNFSLSDIENRLFLTSFTKFSKSIYSMIIPVILGILFIPLVINGSLLSRLTEDQRWICGGVFLLLILVLYTYSLRYKVIKIEEVDRL